MSQETLNLLIGALIGILSSLLTVTVGNYFQDRREIRKRKWELEDREFNGHTDTKNDRLREAQSYLDTYNETGRLLVDAEIQLMTTADIDKSLKELDAIRELMNFTSRKLLSIHALNDPKLKELNEKLVSHFINETTNLLDLRSRIINSKDDIDKEQVSRSITKFNLGMAELIREMQFRLNELAETMK
jgi:hypothetical protein